MTEAQDDKVDELYQTKMQNEGVDLAKYREVVRGDVIRTKLEDKIVADVTKPGPQRQVSEIYIPSGDVEVPESAVKVRHILFSPNNTVPDSSASPLPSDDPAWEKAKADADAAYAKLKVNPELFDEMARTESDETGALGTTGSGGKLPGYIAPDDTQYVPSSSRRSTPTTRPTGRCSRRSGRASAGMSCRSCTTRPTRPRWRRSRPRPTGAGTSRSSRGTSRRAPTSGAGGDLGWIARGQLDQQQVDAIFAAPIGKTSEIVNVTDDGLYLYKVFEEQERTPEGRQLDDLRQNAFSDWYADKKEQVVIDRGEGSV